MFLAIDTVFEQCSVVVISKDLQILSRQTLTGAREQTQQILPMIDVALQQVDIKLEQLTALIFNRGPGAFSGIRINTSVVQALAVAHDLPCVGVSSLAALAQMAFEKHRLKHVYAALDARMQQVYFGEYKLSHFESYEVMTQVDGSKEVLLDYNERTLKPLPIIGNGAALLSLHVDQQIVAELCPDATSIATLGVAQFMKSGGVTADQALPIYLRNNAWKTLKEQGKNV